MGGDTDHSGVIGEEFFTKRNIGGDAIFTGDLAGEGAESHVADDATP